MVATPIGNLGDVTLRALEVLKSVDFVAAEDTRHTLQLLTHFGIKKPLVSCRAQNEAAVAAKIAARLDKGETAAFASDAGTPGLSDPGAVLAGLVRQAGHTVTPIPGASAFAALLSVAGQPGKAVVFEGFLSPKAGRRASRLRELLGGDAAVILYESPYRVVKLLSALADIDNERTVVVGRELTKVHEEILEGSAASLRDVFIERERTNPSTLKGEFAIVVAGEKKSNIIGKSADTIIYTR
jgi:16S rRNA (cytidine1402-2'-O)-methyltransferase